MYVFVNWKNFQEQLGHLNDFQKIYLEAFPNPNEQEPYSNILDRISAQGGALETYAVLDIDGAAVRGGIIADWYPEAASLEIIYIAVDGRIRRAGLGNALLSEGVKKFRSKIPGIKYIFFESENPMDPENHPSGEAGAGMDAVNRLWFFARAGAARLPIDYVQPPLQEGGGFASNMYLFILPSDGEDRMPSEDLKSFLQAFYDGLKEEAKGQEKEWTAELERMEGQIDEVADENGDVVFDHILETPRYRMDKVSIAGHFRKTDQASQKLIEESLAVCSVFHSYETDLMDYSHQGDDRPFVTHFHSMECNVLLHLPKCYQYTSEGEAYFRLVDRNPLEVDVSVNWSYRKDTGEVLAHLVICPSEGSSFSELDIIRLVTAFGSKQEQFRAISPANTEAKSGWDGFRLSRKGSPEIFTVQEWLSNALPGGGAFQMEGSGISDLNMEGLLSENGEPLFQSFDDFKADVPNASMWNRTLCGMLLGIFDFERMNKPEVFDTIQPMVDRGDSFCLLSRGHLMKLSLQNDEEYERVDNILISPYLLIPSAAVALNEILLRRNDEILNLADANSDKDKKPSKLIRFFSDKWYMSRGRRIQHDVTRVAKSLTGEYLDAFFQYGSEQEILQTASERRGLTRKKDLLQRKLDNLKAEAIDYQKIYEDGLNTNENMILLVLAILQVVTALFHDGQEVWLILTSLTLVLVFLIIGRQRLNQKRKE